MSVLGDRIRELRIEKGESQASLGKQLKVGKTTISNYETGYSSPDTETLSKLADILGTTTDYLLGRTDEKNPYEPETIAAHKEGDEWSEEELQSIEEFKEFVRSRRRQTGDKK